MGVSSVLDQYQQKFCDSDAKNIRLLAPAGSGKTHSLLHRCAALSKRTEGRSRFLLVTFTRAARDELRSRLARPPFLELAGSIDVTTLNSWGWKRVRERNHSPKLLNQTERKFAVSNSLQPIWKKYQMLSDALAKKPVPSGKLIMNASDQLKNLAFDHTAHTTPAKLSAHAEYLEQAGAGAIISFIAKELHDARMISSSSVAAVLAEFMPFWREASQFLIEQSVFTLDDQKYVAYLNILEQIEAKRFPLGGSKYSDVLVDEFQDISPLDLSLISSIAELHRAGLTIVGDDDQAIFEWRGATPSYILDPEKWLKREFATYILERNYRCPKNLVEHSQALIKNNKNRHPKRVEARHTANAAINVEFREDFAESVDFVVSKVAGFCDAQHGATDRLALVSRKRAQLIPYQIVLAQKGINFCAAEDLQVFLSESFDALLNMVGVRLDAEARRRPNIVVEDILSLCDKVKRFPLSKADKGALRIHLAKGQPRKLSDAVDLLASYSGQLKGENDAGKMSATFADALRDLLQTDTVCEAIEAISENFHGMTKDYGRAEEDIFFADPPFYYLGRFAERYGTDFEKFVDDIENAKNTLAHIPPDTEAIDDSWSRPVHLMTALRAKGKEFHTVVLLDVNDGIWPMRQAESAAQKEGERRVFYVAMTRAKKELLLTVSNRIGTAVGIPSPFLAEAKLTPTLV